MPQISSLETVVKTIEPPSTISGRMSRSIDTLKAAHAMLDSIIHAGERIAAQAR